MSEQLVKKQMSDNVNTGFVRKCIYCEYYMFHSNRHLCFYGNLADIFMNGAREKNPMDTCRHFVLMRALQADKEKQK